MRWILPCLLGPSLAFADTVHLCVPPDPVEDGAAAAISRLTGGVRVARSCAASGYRGRFLRDGGGVVLEISADDGLRSKLRVPWLTSTDRPLSETVLLAQERTLALKIESFVVGHALTRGGEDEGPTVAAAPPTAPPRAARRRRPKRVAPTPPPAPAPVSAPPSEPPPTPIAIAPPSEPPRAPATRPPAPEPRPVVVEVRPLPPPSTTEWWLSVGGGGLWRRPDVLAGQIEIGAGVGPWLLGLGFQPAQDWSWDGRTFRSQTLALDLGGQLPLAEGAGWALHSPMIASAQRSAVERRDIPAGERAFWQAGLGTGVRLRLRWLDPLWLGLEANGRWMPLGELVVDEGPIVPFNTFSAGLRARLVLRY